MTCQYTEEWNFHEKSVINILVINFQFNDDNLNSTMR